MDETPPRVSDPPPDALELARHRHAHRPAVPSPPASVFVYAWLLTAVSVTVFLAAGPAQGSLGIFLACAGMALTFFPARARVEWPLWLAVGSLLVCGSLAFLPARWFQTPMWRTTLYTSPLIHLPSTVTPVPWETGFWLALLGLSCLTGLFLLAHPVRSRTTLWLAAAAVLVCGIYSALATYARQTGWQYPFTGGATFGFFPNRNHTATFLVTGSIAAMGVLTIGLRERRWAFSVVVGAAMTLCVAGLFFYSGSRGGVIFLVVGTLVWVAGLGGTHRNVPLLVSVVALTCAAGVLFILSGGEARARLLGTNAPEEHAKPPEILDSVPRTSPDSLPGNNPDTPLGFRLQIYRDAATLIKDSPVSGVGFGAFAPVFAQYRRASLSAATSIHPESDWLMLTAEAGVPAMFFALVAGGLLFLRLRGVHHHPFWPLRWGCVAAAATALLHGAVDVPAHRVALGWWIVLLASLGFQFKRERDVQSPLVQRIFFVLGGIGAIALGVQMIRAEWFGAQPLPPFAAGKAREEILALYNRQEAQDALERAQEAVKVSPLSAPLYYQVGTLLLHFDGTDAEADAAFEAQRLLNPTSPSIPLQQGDAWLPVDPKRTVALWLDALDRQSRIDRIQAAGPGHLDAFLWDLLNRARQSTEVQRGLASAATRSPNLLLAWLDGASPMAVRAEFPALLAQTDLLSRLTTHQKEQFLLRWYAKGPREDLAQFLEENRTWQTAAWPVHLRVLVDSQRFEQAVRDVCEHHRISLELPAVTTTSEHADPPLSGGDPVATFETRWREGNPGAARRALDEATRSDATQTINPEIWRLKAAVDAHDSSWPPAWRNLELYLRQSHRDEDIP